jgi:hypothetical protein
VWPSPPYFAGDQSQPRFVLEQIDDGTFHVATPFVYRPKPPRVPVEVNSNTLPATDLASIPWFVSWFVSRHGRHTPAALVHDCLVHDARQRHDPAARAQADLEFRDALDELGVPPVRGRVMWSAVTFGTRWGTDWLRRIALLVWLGAALAGTAAFTVGVVNFQPMMMVAAALGPVLGAVLWGRQYVAGVVGGYTLLVIAVPTFACVAGYGVYWFVEQTVRLLRKPLKQNRGKELPGATPFGQVFSVAKK